MPGEFSASKTAGLLSLSRIALVISCACACTSPVLALAANSWLSCKASALEERRCRSETERAGCYEYNRNRKLVWRQEGRKTHCCDGTFFFFLSTPQSQRCCVCKKSQRRGNVPRKLTLLTEKCSPYRLPLLKGRQT